ncbi:hypothetical protein KGF57_000057 [Candida theae]|uniref:Phosphoglycerate mutase n=1 Tax=Candida theae TaxID=1198502 RepID=A0AAD5G1D2_9ASCO|nr:uncharacterized protein KGF57_000057 [Candida theae]KAI5968942.1 hypothetical protein KGF57_000057 [Candida theae]
MGKPTSNCDKSVNSNTPNHLVPLTTKGHHQSLEAGKALAKFVHHQAVQDSSNRRSRKTIMFYTSPYRRTRETCQNIIEGIKDEPGIEYRVQEETRMREQDFGNFQKSKEEMEKIWEERAHYGHFFYRIPHGESAADVYDRVATFNETLYRQFKSDDFPNILVLVSHGIWSRVFLMKWFKWTYEEFESLKNIPHCQYIIMKKNPNTQKYHLKTKLRTWEDTDDSWMEHEVVKEFGDELECKNVGKELDDAEVDALVQAQREAINSTRPKDTKIEETYKSVRARGLIRNQGTKFDIGNQSVANSVESLIQSPK